MPSRVIWCLGMYASASTWLLNAVREIQIAAGRPGVFVQFVSTQLDVEPLDRGDRVTLIKSHEISNEAALLAVASRSDTILVTVREPRDAVASLMEYQRTEFPQALKLVKESSALCLDFLKDRRATLLAYETHFFDEPATLLKLAQRMGCVLSADTARECFERLSRAAVEKHIEQFPTRRGILHNRLSGDFLDPQTQWHTHHAGRSGEIGRWRRQLSAAQAEEVEGLAETQRIHRLAAVPKHRRG